MKTKLTILFALAIVFTTVLFYSCDKIEAPFFKPIYTEKNVSFEYIDDAQKLDASAYKDFEKLLASNEHIIPIVVLSGDVSVDGNTEDAKTIVKDYALNTSDNLTMIDREQQADKFGISKNSWEENLNKRLQKKAEISVELNKSIDYNVQTLKVDIGLTALNGTKNNLLINNYLLLDSVKSGTTILMNVLQKASTEIYYKQEIMRMGKVSFATSFDIKKYIDNDEIHNLTVVTLVQDATTKEVLKTDKIKIGGIAFEKTPKVIIDDFTGHRCGNCPKAHRELASILATYGEKVIPIAIHNSDHFTDTNEEYPTDFTCSAANALGSFFNVSSKPKGMVNRKGPDGNKLKNYSEWNAMLTSALTKTPSVGIALESKLDGNLLSVDAYVKAFEQQDTSLYLQVYLIESHIIADQEDYDESPSHIEDYEHNHVLRASMNGDMGEILQKGVITKNKILTRQYQYTLKSEWEKENMAIVAFVYNGKTFEILQATEIKLE